MVKIHVETSDTCRGRNPFPLITTDSPPYSSVRGGWKSHGEITPLPYSSIPHSMLLKTTSSTAGLGQLLACSSAAAAAAGPKVAAGILCHHDQNGAAAGGLLHCCQAQGKSWFPPLYILARTAAGVFHCCCQAKVAAGSRMAASICLLCSAKSPIVFGRDLNLLYMFLLKFGIFLQT